MCNTLQLLTAFPRLSRRVFSSHQPDGSLSRLRTCSIETALGICRQSRQVSILRPIELSVDYHPSQQSSSSIFYLYIV